MGKLLICTDEYYKKIFDNFIDFEQNGLFEGEYGKVCTFKKLRVDSKNNYKNGSDFCATAGTAIYKGMIGEDGLSQLLADYESVYDIRANMVGSYCMAVNKNGKLSVFVDPSSSYNVYYYISDDAKQIVLTNSYFHVALVVPNVISDEKKLLSNLQHKSINADTPFEGVKKLMGNEMLVFENSEWHLRTLSYPQIDNNDDIVTKAISLYNNIGNLFSTSGVFMTGGQDSRLALSLMLNRGMKPTLFYGIGDSADTNTKTEDFNCVKLMSEKYSLTIQTMNWKNSSSDKYEYYLRKYGELHTLYCMNENIFNEFENNINCEFIALGYFGEVYRNVETIADYKKDKYSLDEFIDEIYMCGISGMFEEGKYSDYRDFIKSQFLEICHTNSLNPDCLTKQDFQTLNTVYRQKWDTLMNNFVNQYFYSIPLFGDYRLTKLAETVEYDHKDKSRFLLNVMKKLKADILDVPFFSHIKVKKYDSKKGILVDAQLSSRIKDKVRSMIRGEKMMRFARKIYYILRNDKKGRVEIEKQYDEKHMLIDQFYSAFDLKSINADAMFLSSSSGAIKQFLLHQKMVSFVVNGKR